MALEDGLLPFEWEAFQNVLNENSLTISSKGLLNDRLLYHLVTTFCNPSQLVFVIGCNPEEENSIMCQIDEYRASGSLDPEFQAPQFISYGSGKSQDRRQLYLSGGVFFITGRILIVDMLYNRVPFASVSGIIVANAHTAIQNCHISFILRLFRQNNKTGFITALSQKPRSFLGSFAKLDRFMRTLFVGKLNLWPRFHSLVMETFAVNPPKVTEIRVKMTPMVKQIQFALIELISRCIKELTSMNSFLFSNTADGEWSLNTMSVICSNFSRLVRSHLDHVWYQLSSRSRRLICDIQLLKSLMFHLTELDAVTFFMETKHIRDSVAPDRNPSDWLFWPEADTVFRVAEERVFLTNAKGARTYHIEIEPKLEALSDLIKDLEHRIMDEEEHKKNEEIIDIIIVVENRYTLNRIERFQDKGREVVVEELKTKCEMILNDKKKIELFRKPAPKKPKDDLEGDEGIIEFEDQVTLTQMMGRIQDHESSIIRKHKHFQIQYYDWSSDYNYGLGLKRLLTTLRPRFVILYEPELAAIRQIESYQALHGRADPVEIFIFFMDESAEEQRYLNIIREEKEAFLKLIEEKKRLPQVIDGEGLVGEHPDLVRGRFSTLHPEEAEANMQNTRIGGIKSNQNVTPRIVLVDLREFRSSLPGCIHKLGLDLEPVTLEIGDYILAPETCIERKSVSDLIQSLNSGRLYAQAQIMTRHYKRSMLLIEFPGAEEAGSLAFSFKSRNWGHGQSWNPESRPNPLVQLAVLLIHFPMLRIIWSPSPQFSAEIFEQLKEGKEEPNKERDVIRVNLNSNELPAQFVTDRFDVETKDFLLCLPGINTYNVYLVMRHFETIADIARHSLEELTEILGNSHNANLLYRALHEPVMETITEETKRQNKEKRRFTYVRKKKT